jgi:hypothetical protein
MTEHVSIWDDPSEQQQTNSTATSTASTTTETDTDEENPIEAAVAASNWSRDDIELALQVANLVLLAYFTMKWRQQNV